MVASMYDDGKGRVEKGRNENVMQYLVNILSFNVRGYVQDISARDLGGIRLHIFGKFQARELLQ
jgi:hypothetical protein